MTKTLDVVQSYQKSLAEVMKDVVIRIDLKDLDILKKSKYKLCFAKKVGDNAYNVVWQSYENYLFNNSFSWVPMYGLFGSNVFQDKVRVRTDTNIVQIKLGERSLLDSSGILSEPVTGGPDTGFTLDNEFGIIHAGVNQLSTGINGEIISTPIYVSQQPVVKGDTLLTPVEKVLVWFEQNIETSTMFSNSRSKSVEIDMTQTNNATRLYENGEWKTV